MNRTQRGSEAEALAEQYLNRRGYRTLRRNYRCRGGEIDLVMVARLNARCLVCVEVRFRSSDAYGGAIASITRAKQTRLIRAAHHLRQRLDDPYAALPLRFDVIGIDAHRGSRSFTWLRAAFEC